MKFSNILCIIGGFIGLGLMVFTFLGNSSPYVTIEEGRKLTNSHLHLLGEVVSGSFVTSMDTASSRFLLKDTEGKLAHVVLKGSLPPNMNGVNKVVAVGEFKGDIFIAEKLLCKCPSKYESINEAPKSP